MKIEDMKAGRELDCEIDEKIFGNTWTHIAPDMPWDDIPEYSTDIAEAWQVVEKITEPRNDDANTKFMLWWESSQLWAMNSKEASEAICLAALKAIE